MAKLTIPLTAVQIGGNLRDWFYNNVVLNSEITYKPEGANLVVNDDFATNKLVMNQQAIINILAEGGEVSEYLAGIRAPNTLGAVTVPVGLPERTNILGQTVNFLNWFSNKAELWVEDVGDEFIFYTNPFAGSVDKYLTASQMEIIRQINTGTITILTVAEVQAVVESGWTKQIV